MLAVVRAEWSTGKRFLCTFVWIASMVRAELEGWSVITTEWAPEREAMRLGRAVPDPNSKVDFWKRLNGASVGDEGEEVVSIKEAAMTAAFQR
jgi:hypothetical protein